MSNKLSIINLHHGEHAVSHLDLKAGKELKSLWFEIPEFCHLFCDYCFASTNSNNIRNTISKKCDKYLKWDEYEKLLIDFAAAGGEFIGIPGRGEPFHPNNLELTKKIILLAQKLELKTTIFTTGETIFFKPKYSEKNVLSLNNDPDFELMNFLLDKDLVILIKWNSDNEDIQDRIVHTKNYTKLRERALDLLIKNNFNQEHKPKLGIVTSILKDNINEIVGLYRKYKKEKGLIFDCDTILPRGRGEQYFNRDDNLTHNQLSEVFNKLKNEGAILTCQGGTYVGEPCDRILHHLYVELKGNVYPCIGCFENHNNREFYLGNIKQSSISELWNHPKRKKLREQTREVFTGACFNCQNFEDNNCYSCLGRCVSSVDSGENDLLIDTHGCTNHRPKLVPWINTSTDYIRKILSFEESKLVLNTNLENLWRPNQNIAFVLNQLSEKDKFNEIQKIINVDDAHNNDLYKPGEVFKKVPVKRFSLKKHFRYSDLDFPSNKVWDFIKFPIHTFEDPDKFNDNKRSKLIKELSKSFLSNIFLPSIKLLFDKYDRDENILLCNLLFYDNRNQKYFYRTISKNEAEGDIGFDISLILFRWAEDIDGYNYFSDHSKGKIYNLSSTFRNEFYRDYELILNKPTDYQLQYSQEQTNVFLLYQLINCPLVDVKAKDLDRYLMNLVDDLNSEWDIIKGFLNSSIFNDLTEVEKKKLKNFYEKLNNVTFYNKDDIINENPALLNAVKEFIRSNIKIRNLKDNYKVKLEQDLYKCTTISQINTVLLKEDDFKKSNKSLWDFTKLLEYNCAGILNYLIFLRFLNYKFNINNYFLTHSTNFKASSFVDEKLSDESVFGEITQPSGILLCSKRPLCRELKSEIEIFLSNILQPFDEFYYNLNIQNIKLYNEVQWYQHSLDNIYTKYSDTYNFLEESIKNKNMEQIAVDFEKLRNRFKVYDISRRGISKKLKGIDDYVELNTISSIITLIFNNLECKSKLNIHTDILIDTYSPRDKLFTFTIFYNLLKNASRHDNNQEVIVDLSEKTLKIINYKKMNQEYVDYINNLSQKYPTGEKNRGLEIVKEAAKHLNWRIEAITNKEETSIKININP